ncbi:MAG: hypothetical protein HY652_11490 [Acidobacteria bacterium]|nr:hypothetical protein [Acidobacteriota bacterium]
MTHRLGYRAVLFLTVVMASRLSHPLGAQQEKLPAPRHPKIPKITSVEQLLPNARIVVKRERHLADGIIGIGLKAGEKVLITANSSWDPLVIEALRIAIAEAGGKVDILIRGAENLGSSASEGFFGREPADAMRIRDFTGAQPTWLSQAMREHDVVVGFLADGATWGRIGKTRTIRWEYPRADQLASPAVSYPDELLEAIAQKVWGQIKGAREVRITDPLGTDMTFTLGDKYWEEYAQRWGKATWGTVDLNKPIPHEVHAMVVPSLAGKPDAKGIIVARGLHSGPIAELKVYFEGGQVVKVEGGGKAGEYIKEALERFKNTPYPDYPGPGVGWLEEVSLGTNPKAFRPYTYDEYVKMGRFSEWSFGRRRSGVIHMAIGTRHNLERVTDQRSGLPYNHRDFEIYFPTYYVDGKKIVENGRLLTLDDPEIRRIAAKYGDPDELLREDWIPELGK